MEFSVLNLSFEEVMYVSGVFSIKLRVLGRLGVFVEFSVLN